MAEPGDGPWTPRRRQRRRALLLALAVVVAGAAVPYLAIDDEPDPLDDSARATAGGSFARLSAGHTHYQVAGPTDGETVVLVHGTTIPSFVWDRNVGALAGAGWRVVRYDLYGRGLSDRPDVPYDLDLYVRQLEELLGRVAPGRPVSLVGLSLGGMVVAEFTRRHPDRVRKLVLVGPAGVGTRLPLAARVAVAPGIGEYVMRVHGTRQLLPSRRNVLHPDRHAALDSAYLGTVRFRGSRRAVLKTLRSVPVNGYENGYRALGALGKPTLLVWGRQGGVVPFAASGRVRELVRPAAFLAVDGAGHLPHYERPEVVNPALLEFLAR